MAAKDDLSHEVLGPFSRRIAPARAGRAAENIAYGYEGFEKTLGQWIDSSEHRANLLLHNASRIGVASARDASGKAYLLGHGDCRRLRAGEGQKRQGASCCRET